MQNSNVSGVGEPMVDLTCQETIPFLDFCTLAEDVCNVYLLNGDAKGDILGKYVYLYKIM